MLLSTSVIPTYYYAEKLCDAFRKRDKSVSAIIYSKTRQSKTINYGELLARRTQILIIRYRVLNHNKYHYFGRISVEPNRLRSKNESAPHTSGVGKKIPKRDLRSRFPRQPFRGSKVLASVITQTVKDFRNALNVIITVYYNNATTMNIFKYRPCVLFKIQVFYNTYPELRRCASLSIHNTLSAPEKASFDNILLYKCIIAAGISLLFEGRKINFVRKFQVVKPNFFNVPKQNTHIYIYFK